MVVALLLFKLLGGVAFGLEGAIAVLDDAAFSACDAAQELEVAVSLYRNFYFKFSL